MDRKQFLIKIKELFRVHPVCAILGPRQCGKTTLARQFTQEFDSSQVHWYDLEDPRDLVRLNQPMLSLETLEGLIVIDEIQRRPDLFPLLRVLVDRRPAHQQYLILGSASKILLQQSSESLTGRIGYMELTPFSIPEVQDIDTLWVRGGFPRSFLSASDADSFTWRTNYIRTFLEMDLPNLGFNIPAQQLYRFWMMLTQYHGQLFNASDLGRSLSVSDHTVRKYLDILEGTFMVRTLQPWFANIQKRHVKTPKIYFRDSGLLNALLDLSNRTAMERYARFGALWEGFALEEILRFHALHPNQAFFWRTHAGAELDLLFKQEDRLIGFEFKYADAPKLTPSMRLAIEDLGLEKLNVIYPGNVDYPLGHNIYVYGMKSYLSQP
jgi:predicted AAA+ superfamily ATPase